MNIKQIEFGVIGVLLENAPELTDITGTLATQIDEEANISTISLNLAESPAENKGGIWLTGNPGNFQRFEFNGVSDNGSGKYTFNLKKLTKVKATVLIGTDAYIELKDLPIFEYGDTVDSEDTDFIQSKVEQNKQEFPNITGDASNIWSITAMVAVVNRIAQDKLRDSLTDIYSSVEHVFVKNMTTSDLSSYSAIQVLGVLQSENEDGKWDNERQGLIAEIDVKYYYE
jgi:hypothetical protein